MTIVIPLECSAERPKQKRKRSQKKRTGEFDEMERAEERTDKNSPDGSFRAARPRWGCLGWPSMKGQGNTAQSTFTSPPRCAEASFHQATCRFIICDCVAVCLYHTGEPHYHWWNIIIGKGPQRDLSALRSSCERHCSFHSFQPPAGRTEEKRQQGKRQVKD